MKPNYEIDNDRWPDDAYFVQGFNGVAMRVMGWETQPDEDTVWDGLEKRTGMVICIMVGDDYRHIVDPDDISEMDPLSYCHVCGQIGCAHDGIER